MLPAVPSGSSFAVFNKGSLTELKSLGSTSVLINFPFLTAADSLRGMELDNDGLLINSINNNNDIKKGILITNLVRVGDISHFGVEEDDKTDEGFIGSSIFPI
jgi:hypothetical protein